MAAVQGAELLESSLNGGEPAKTRKRPGPQRVLSLVATGAVRAVIVAKLDRLTRSVKDLSAVLGLFEKRGVALLAVAESLDAASAAGRLVITIMGAVSQWQREAIGERTREALRHKRAQGERAGNVACGMRLAGDGIHPEGRPGEQAVLAEIRRLRGDGDAGVAAELNRRGYRMRLGTDWRLEPAAWARSTAAHIGKCGKARFRAFCGQFAGILPGTRDPQRGLEVVAGGSRDPGAPGETAAQARRKDATQLAPVSKALDLVALASRASELFVDQPAST